MPESSIDLTQWVGDGDPAEIPSVIYPGQPPLHARRSSPGEGLSSETSLEPRHRPIQQRDIATRPNSWDLPDRQQKVSNHAMRKSGKHRSLERSRFNPWSAVLISLSVTLGLVGTQIANRLVINNGNYTIGVDFWWAGLFLIFIPIAVRLTMRGTGRGERIILAVLLGAVFYVVKVQGSPQAFTFIDEYIHLRNTENILKTGHTFGYNPLLPTAAYYPGLGAVAAALVRLTGLNTFVAGLIIIGVARLLVSTCIFLLAEKVTGSARAAGVASLVYVANPMFLFWSASFSYEDLALPLAFFVVWWLGKTRTTSYPAQLVTVISVFAVIFTHHISAFALTGILAAWLVAEIIVRKPYTDWRYVAAFAVLAGVTSILWFFFVARPASSYIVSENVAPALKEMRAIIVSHHADRQLYTGGGNAPPPLWYAMAGFVAVGVTMAALLPALWRAWILFTTKNVGNPLYRRASLLVVSIIAASFPFTLLPRLTTTGGSISSRTSEYVFAGIGCTLGLLAIEGVNFQARYFSKVSRSINWLFAASRGTAILVTMIVAIFIGEITIGSPYQQLLPPSSNSAGFPWLVEPDVISASIWASEHLGTYQAFATDYMDSLALATYGEENPRPTDTVLPIFFSNSLNGISALTIRATGVRYILVDWRITYGLPTNPGDYYFSMWEPGAGHYTRPFPASYLQKFDSYSCSRLIYHSGPIEIFDVTTIENGTCVPQPLKTVSPRKAVSSDIGTSRNRNSS
jgi:hypothetical protein